MCLLLFINLWPYIVKAGILTGQLCISITLHGYYSVVTCSFFAFSRGLFMAVPVIVEDISGFLRKFILSIVIIFKLEENKCKHVSTISIIGTINKNSHCCDMINLSDSFYKTLHCDHVPTIYSLICTPGQISLLLYYSNNEILFLEMVLHLLVSFYIQNTWYWERVCDTVRFWDMSTAHETVKIHKFAWFVLSTQWICRKCPMCVRLTPRVRSSNCLIG